MKEQFIFKNFKSVSKKMIITVNNIVADYQRQGYSLTLRQLYYQFVAKDLFPEEWFDREANSYNTQKNYKKLGELVNNARLCGQVDWDVIKDITRELRGYSTYRDPAELIDSCVWRYNIDKWINAEYRVEVWVEKDALIEVVGKAAGYREVDYFSCRGYVSQSAMYKAGKRLISIQQRENKKIVIIHLGDHDPSGIDMTRDIETRLNMFMEPHGCKIKMKRIALTMAQIKKYKPPPNPAKVTDSRYTSYVEKYGEESWELDALEPSVLDALIKKEVSKYVDMEEYERREEKEEEGKETLKRIARDLNNEMEEEDDE